MRKTTNKWGGRTGWGGGNRYAAFVEKTKEEPPKPKKATTKRKATRTRQIAKQPKETRKEVKPVRNYQPTKKKIRTRDTRKKGLYKLVKKLRDMGYTEIDINNIEDIINDYKRAAELDKTLTLRGYKYQAYGDIARYGDARKTVRETLSETYEARQEQQQKRERGISSYFHTID